MLGSSPNLHHHSHIKRVISKAAFWKGPGWVSFTKETVAVHKDKRNVICCIPSIGRVRNLGCVMGAIKTQSAEMSLNVTSKQKNSHA